MSTRVWDCFPVNDELDLLEFRLEHLDPVVDRFVIVEAPMTFSGKPKPLNFSANKERFARWEHKIVHQVADLPSLGDVSPWHREAAQRGALKAALAEAAPDDVVLVGDLDEIPYPEVIETLKRDLSAPTRLILRWSNYRGNFEAPEAWTDGTKACRGRDLDDFDEMGLILGEIEAPHMAGRDSRTLTDAGWHLSYVGPVDFVQRKVGAFSHRTLDRPDLRSDGHVSRCLDLGVFLDGRFAMRRLQPDEFDPLLRALQARNPEMIDLRPPPPRWRVLSYLAYSRFLMANLLPGPLARAAQRNVWRTLALAGFPLVAADQALRAARRHRIRARLRRLLGRFSRR